MPISGVQTAVFGVEDLELCDKFFADFELKVSSKSDTAITYGLPEGSYVVLKKSNDVSLPPAYSPGSGIREVIWGVDEQSALDGIEAELKKDRIVTKDPDGTLHSADDLGLGIGFRIFKRQPLLAKDDQVNAPGRSARWNKHRTWYDKATPQLIYHVVFGCSDLDKPVGFYRDRLKFRITDVARDRGIFFRAEGRSDHHNIFWALTGKPQFLHISFGVENLDELLAGANDMQRKGWKSQLGLGRHRISSTLYFYIQSPAGGEAEYSADPDCLDDSWQPRIWEPLFGNQHWVATLPAFLATPPKEDVHLLVDERPDLARIVS